MAPLEKPLAEASIQIPLLHGVEGTVDSIGWSLVGGATAGSVGHAIYSGIVKHGQKGPEEAQKKENSTEET